MSKSPTCRRDTAAAAASPESPEEGDFSSRQLCDKPRSPEEHETCEDHKDPVVNIAPNNCSSSLLNTHVCAPLATNDLGKLCAGLIQQEESIKKSQRRVSRCFSMTPVKEKLSVDSPEFMEVRTLDGRFITLVSTQAQTDWEWVEQRLSFSCQVQKEIDDPQLLQAEVLSLDSGPDSSQAACSEQKETEEEKMLKEKRDVPCVGLPRLIAYRPEPKQTLHVEKVSEVESKQDVHLAQCVYCQQLCQLFIYSELLASEKGSERPFCCEQAKQMRELILEEREKLMQEEPNRKINVNVHALIMTEEEWEAAKERTERERLRRLQLQRKLKQDSFTKELRRVEIKTKTFELKEIPIINHKPHIINIDIKNTTGMFTRREETDGEPKLKGVTKKFFKSGKCFLTLCPDGTGNVFYPSGNAAIIISSAEAADFTYIILEDKDDEPGIKGIFTNNGYSTCYHPNGVIWFNLTPAGGLCLSETGALRRRWKWASFDPCVRNLPFKPLAFALGPHIGVHIHSQQHMYVAFAHQKNRVRFRVGLKQKVIYPESQDKPGEDALERYIQMKISEFYVLLEQMKTCLSHPCSFIMKTKQLSRQGEEKKLAKKI